jgi:hypothetical protein
MQTLPNEDMLFGSGFNGVVTEFSPSGKALCDAFFVASTYLGMGDVQSYRAYKDYWTGLPTMPVDLVLHDDIFYVSWLGATEVKESVLRSGFREDEEWIEFVRLRKNGFETDYTLLAEQRVKRWVKAYALEEDERELGASESLDVAEQVAMDHVHGLVNDKVEEEEESKQEEGSMEGYYSAAGVVMAVLGLCGMLVPLGVLACLPRLRRGEGESRGIGGMSEDSFKDEERCSFLKTESTDVTRAEARDFAWRPGADI